MTKITIFGATGGTGKELVEQALAAGYDVVAYARDPSRLGIGHEHLTVVQGELSGKASIEDAIQGADAVLSALGPHGRSKNKPISQGMQYITATMKKQGVRRLLITSTLSAKDPNDKPDFRTLPLTTFLAESELPSYRHLSLHLL